MKNNHYQEKMTTKLIELAKRFSLMLVCILIWSHQFVEASNLFELANEPLGLTFHDSPTGTSIVLNHLGDRQQQQQYPEPASLSGGSLQRFIIKDADLDGRLRGKPSSLSRRERIEELLDALSMFVPNSRADQLPVSGQQQQQQQLLDNALGVSRDTRQARQNNNSNGSQSSQVRQSSAEAGSNYQPWRSSSQDDSSGSNKQQQQQQQQQQQVGTTKIRKSGKMGQHQFGHSKPMPFWNGMQPGPSIRAAYSSSSPVNGPSSSLGERPAHEIGQADKSKEVAMFAPTKSHLFGAFGGASGDFESKRTETSRWNNLRGMWGKRSISDRSMLDEHDVSDLNEARNFLHLYASELQRGQGENNNNLKSLLQSRQAFREAPEGLDDLGESSASMTKAM